MTCSNCGGEMNGSDVLSYCRGFAAAGGDAKEVWPEFTEGE